MRLVISERHWFDDPKLDADIVAEIKSGQLNLEEIAERTKLEILQEWVDELRPKKQMEVDFTDKTTKKEVNNVIRNLKNVAYKLVQEKLTIPEWGDWVREELKEKHKRIEARIKSYEYRLRNWTKETGWDNPADAGRITAEDIEQAKQRPITDFIDGNIRRSGKRKIIRCPFHNERSGSFVIYPTNDFHCFGCQVNGDVIAFVMRQQNLKFIEAVKFLINK